MEGNQKKNRNKRGTKMEQYESDLEQIALNNIKKRKLERKSKN